MEQAEVIDATKGMEDPHERSLTIIESTVKWFKGWALTVKVKNNDEYAQVGEELKSIKRAQESVKAFFDPDIAKAHELHKSLTAKRKAFLDPLNEAEAAGKSARITWDNEQERLRKAEQDRLDAEARAKEEKEKAKLEAKAQKAEANGDAAAAEAIRERKEQVIVQAPIAAPRTVETAGIKKVKKWKAEVTDPLALIKAVAEGKAPIGLVMPNDQALQRQAVATRDTFHVPGVRFYEITIEAVGK